MAADKRGIVNKTSRIVICLLLSILLVVSGVPVWASELDEPGVPSVEDVQEPEPSLVGDNNELEDEPQEELDASVEEPIEEPTEEPAAPVESDEPELESLEEPLVEDEIVALSEEDLEEPQEESSRKSGTPAVLYRTHVQRDGWQGWKKDGATAGTSGRSLRLEGIEIKLANTSVTGGIAYRTHVQKVGWQAWKKNGAMSGTSGKSLRLEAIQIKLTGKVAQEYDVYYRVHAQTYGWMGWAKNGATSGTAGKAKRLEAIQIVLVAKGARAPSNSGQQTKAPFVGTEGLSVSAHVQSIGWMTSVGSGKTAGTTGKGLRLEALRFSLAGPRVPGGIEGSAYMQGSGWQNWRTGEIGLTGQGKRVEAVKLRLTGDAADTYDLYYRAYVQNGGWMAWTSNGEAAGTKGLATRMEAIQICLLRKGAAHPSASGQKISKPFVSQQSVSYNVRISDAWQGWKLNGKTAGSAGSTITGLQVKTEGELPGSIVYAVQVSDGGWTDDAHNGGTAANGTKRVEAFRAKLTGQVARLYNVWYRGYVHGKGWMGWTKNGNAAGSEGLALALEAVQVRIVSKAKSAPGSTSLPLYDSAERLVEGMTLKQRIAQLFVVAPEALTGGGTVTSGSTSLQNAYAAYPVGGVIYFGANLKGPSQTKKLLSSVRSYSMNACGLPPFQCVDEEGGTVARIAGNSAFGVTNVGNMSSIGASGNTSRARAAGSTMGTYLSSLGFNVDFAPVADVSAASGVMGKRSFGNNPQLVSSMVAAEISGFQSTGVLCCAKHFPGIGAAKNDPHYVRIYSNKTEAQLSSWELVPFREACNAGVPMVMVGHLYCKKLANGSSLPGSMNPAVINGLLRGKLGYNGLVITDALAMGAATDVCSDARQGVLAIKAGADIVLIPNDFKKAYNGLYNAVKSGEISEARINESVRRVIRAKSSL